MEKVQRKKHRIKTCKCNYCKKQLNISDYIERKDYDYYDDTHILIYCEYCGSQEVIER